MKKIQQKGVGEGGGAEKEVTLKKRGKKRYSIVTFGKRGHSLDCSRVTKNEMEIVRK